MSNAWIAFAKTGNPATKDLPQWSPYSADHGTTMIFDDNPRVENDPARTATVLAGRRAPPGIQSNAVAGQDRLPSFR